MTKRVSLAIIFAVTIQLLHSQVFRLNQLGFYGKSQKIAIVTESNNKTFELINAATGKIEYSDTLTKAKQWSYSGENVSIADFSKISNVGDYYLKVGSNTSAIFPIRNKNTYSNIAQWTVKAFYFWRASTPILKQHAQFGKISYERTAGHADTKVLIHSSAATTQRPTGTVVSAPKGWYDAGDYNLYTVNASLAVYPLLQLYENYTSMYDTLSLNIPESNNSLPDILDEVKWETDWLMGMFNPEDGSVYHKLTSLKFSGMVMPSQDNATRYMVGRSTAAALDFAAMMAKAARTFRKFEHLYPGYADSMISMAKKAYEWAKLNPNRYFTNPADVATGAYSDSSTGDEFVWAVCELYLTTGDISYLNTINLTYQNFGVPTWGYIHSLGLFSLYQHVDTLQIPSTTKDIIINSMEQISNTLVNTTNASAYKVATNAFMWGSNGYTATQGMILMETYKRTRNKKYLDAGISVLDYILGRNATGYCFVSGFGQKSPINIHDRRSESDGIVGSLPGYLAGGPTTNALSDCGASMYPSTFPAKSYVDATCSYSTNEIAINWQGPLAYLVGAINAELNNVLIVPTEAITDSTGSKINIIFPTGLKQKNIPVNECKILLNKTEITIDSTKINNNTLVVFLPKQSIDKNNSIIEFQYKGTSLESINNVTIDSAFSTSVRNATTGANSYVIQSSTNQIGDTIYITFNKNIAYINNLDIDSFKVYSLGKNIYKPNAKISITDNIIGIPIQRVFNDQSILLSFYGTNSKAIDSSLIETFEMLSVANNSMPPLPKPIEITANETGNIFTIIFDKPIVKKTNDLQLTATLYNTKTKKTTDIGISTYSVKNDQLIVVVSPRFVKNDSLVVSYKSGCLYSIDNDSVMSFSGLALLIPIVTSQDTFVVSKNNVTKFEAEAYAYNNGFTTEACTDTLGTLNISYADIGDWTEYFINVKDSGNYILTSRVATTKTSGFVVKSYTNQEKSLAYISLPITGGWQKWTNVKTNITLDTGFQILRIQASNTGFNINWFTLEKGIYIPSNISEQTENSNYSLFYPNPCKGNLFLKNEFANTNARITFLNSSGQIISEKPAQTVGSNTMFTIQEKGLIYVKYVNGEQTVIEKIIIQ